MPLSSSSLACVQIVKIIRLSNDYKFYGKIAAVKMVSSQRFGVKFSKESGEIFDFNFLQCLPKI